MACAAFHMALVAVAASR